jgi:hypothetical protein
MNTDRHALQMSSIVVLCWNSTQTAPQCAVILRGGRVVLSPGPVSQLKILEKFFESNKHLSSIDHGREVVRGFVCYIYICDTPNFTGTKNVFVGSLLNILIFGFIYCILGIGTTRVAKLKLYRVRVRFLRAKKRRNEESPESLFP